MVVFSVLVDRKKKKTKKKNEQPARDDDDVDNDDDSGSVPGLGAIFRSARGVDERRGRPRVV